MTCGGCGEKSRSRADSEENCTKEAYNAGKEVGRGHCSREKDDCEDDAEDRSDGGGKARQEGGSKEADSKECGGGKNDVCKDGSEARENVGKVRSKDGIHDGDQESTCAEKGSRDRGQTKENACGKGIRYAARLA